MLDNAQAQPALAEAAGEVLETMFFTAVSPAEQDAPAAASRELTAGVRFKGAPSGMLTLAIAEAPARRIACNFLGAEDESALTDSQVSEVIGELANMICGSVLSRIESDTTFDLDKPAPLTGTETIPALASARCALDVEGSPLTLAMYFDEEEP
ncbi:MAG: chemotaxis protein CheX [bacterium]|jgi:CheY-specific phosphatase CheX